jgi:hypothetical protein
MSLTDFLGLGGQPEFLTDWDSARDFMIYSVIVNNNNLTDTEKVKLQTLEQDAYDENHGKWLLAEREEIARYWNYMLNNSPSITQNEEFLNLLSVGADASVDVASPDDASGVNPTDIIPPKDISKLSYLLIFGASLIVLNRVFK